MDTIQSVANQSKEGTIRDYFRALYQTWGEQHWWPAESRFEVIVGAFLTQNTAWKNVELAMKKLRQAGVLNLAGIRKIPLEQLQELIRSAGYFRQKAKRLKNFVAFVDEKHQGSLVRLFARPTDELRSELLKLDGIGPETADSILLYAGNHEVFVVDAYTRRILARHGVLPEESHYEEIRRLFERALDPEFSREMISKTADVESLVQEKPPGSHHAPSRMSTARRTDRAQIFNEMHGLIVGVGKNYCQSQRVDCERCPLRIFLRKPVKLEKPAKGVKVRAASRRK